MQHLQLIFKVNLIKNPPELPDGFRQTLINYDDLKVS